MKKTIVKTEKFVFGGSCIAAVEGKTVFIPYALPNELLEISIIKEHKNYSEARIEKILQKSPYRVIPKCKKFYLCGGCNMQMANDSYQAELRKTAAVESFVRRLQKTSDVLPNPFLITGDNWGYRARFQFHITPDGNYALKKQNSAELIQIDNCPVADDTINLFLKKQPARVFTGKHFPQGKRLHIFSANGNVYTEENDADCFCRINQKEIKFSPLGFFQSNVKMTEQLIKTIFSKVKISGKVLDFYSGVGTFSLFAFKDADEIHLVEINKHAIAYAKHNFNYEANLCGRKAKVFFHAMDGSYWVKSKASSTFFDIAFIDPPRTGLDKHSLTWFCNSSISVIVYISCDPVSFARDAVALMDAGYTLKHYYLFDFYPQTHHIETLGIFLL